MRIVARELLARPAVNAAQVAMHFRIARGNGLVIARHGRKIQPSKVFHLFGRQFLEIQLRQHAVEVRAATVHFDKLGSQLVAFSVCLIRIHDALPAYG